MIKDDIPNMSLARCQELMLEYQKTDDPMIFSMLLAKFDKYLIHLVYKFNRRYKIMQDEKLQELYHTAIMGFHKAILGIKEKHIPEYMFLFISAFVKYELKTTYWYKTREREYNPEIMECPDSFTPEKFKEKLDAILIEELLKTREFDAMDRRLILLRVQSGMTYKAMGEALGMTQAAVWRKFQDLKRRLLILLEGDNYDNGVHS